MGDRGATTVPLDLCEIRWYHGGISRHIAESLLLVSGQDGSYLLRDDHGKPDACVLSVRCQDSVKHYIVEIEGQTLKFGFGTFKTVQDFLDHFKDQPLVGGESGVLTTLKYPYPRNVEEPEIFEKVGVHTSVGVSSPLQNSVECFLPLGTKEGYLTKLGQFHKVWKTRWFTVYKYEMKYFKNRLDSDPIKTLDLREAVEASFDWSYDKPNLFRLVFPWRTFYLSASSQDEASHWLELLQWKLNKLKKCKCPSKCQH